MGSAYDIMQTFAYKDLHAQFSEYDGWNWTIIPAPRNGNVMYRISRYYHGQQQEAIVTVSFVPQPSAGSVITLTSASTNTHTGHYLLVPQGADVSGIPAGIRILTMTAFGFSDGKLVWLSKKKNAMRYPSKESACA